MQSLDIADAAHFKVVVRTGVGPVKATFTMHVEFVDHRERGARLMQGAADKTTQQVFACIKQKLEAPA